MDAAKLKTILDEHKKWRSGAGGARANLSVANLSGANLSVANLSVANLSVADLSVANLSGADLYGANLYGANLSVANLSVANLSVANLSGADLYGANLSGANLSVANLSGADLYGANLSGADLKYVKNADLVLARTEILPRDGSVIGWKKCRDGVLVKVCVLAKSKRSNAPSSRKCRAERVSVLQVVGGKVGISMHDGETKYVKGKTVWCDKWNEDRMVECGGGIHFFLTREEAEAYK